MRACALASGGHSGQRNAVREAASVASDPRHLREELGRTMLEDVLMVVSQVHGLAGDRLGDARRERQAVWGKATALES